jgi:hypothetical protein
MSIITATCRPVQQLGRRVGMSIVHEVKPEHLREDNQPEAHTRSQRSKDVVVIQKTDKREELKRKGQSLTKYPKKK